MCRHLKTVDDPSMRSKWNRCKRLLAEEFDLVKEIEKVCVAFSDAPGSQLVRSAELLARHRQVVADEDRYGQQLNNDPDVWPAPLPGGRDSIPTASKRNAYSRGRSPSPNHRRPLTPESGSKQNVIARVQNSRLPEPTTTAASSKARGAQSRPSGRGAGVTSVKRGKDTPEKGKKASSGNIKVGKRVVMLRMYEFTTSYCLSALRSCLSAARWPEAVALFSPNVSRCCLSALECCTLAFLRRVKGRAVWACGNDTMRGQIKNWQTFSKGMCSITAQVLDGTKSLVCRMSSACSRRQWFCHH